MESAIVSGSLQCVISIYQLAAAADRLFLKQQRCCWQQHHSFT
jgi:hypothetical protein